MEVDVNTRLDGSEGLAGKASRSRFFHILLLAGLGWLAYSNTFGAPFQWDEHVYLMQNPVVKDLGYFLDPAGARGTEYYSGLVSRFVGYLTFALNYHFDGFRVAGYHVVNLAVHLVNTSILYLVICLLLRTPALKGSLLASRANHVALLGAALFAVHPVQTEAVTYVFQRLASLAALFYLLSLASYIKFRLSKSGKARYAFYALALASTILAMKTKENAFTLPLVIALAEFLFFRARAGARVLMLTPVLLLLLVIPLTLVNFGSAQETFSSLEGISTDGSPATDIMRQGYLLTQPRVIITYLRLLLFPIGQNIDYDYPMYISFDDPNVFVPVAVLSVLLLSGLFLVYISKRYSSAAGLRLTGFGILWFFITLSVESSVVPLRMMITEYRVYLPSAGLFMAASSVGVMLYGRTRRRGVATFATRAMLGAAIAAVFTLSVATYERNYLWQSETALWYDAAEKSPRKARPHNNLGIVFQRNGLYNLAEREFRKAVRDDPTYAEAHVNLGILYLNEALYDKAIKEYEDALKVRKDFYEAHLNMGFAYWRLRDFDDAEKELRIAVNLKPTDMAARMDLGQVYLDAGDYPDAIRQYRNALMIYPDYAPVHNYLGVAYCRGGDHTDAITEYRHALELNPAYAEARRNLDLARRLLKQEEEKRDRHRHAG